MSPLERVAAAVLSGAPPPRTEDIDGWWRVHRARRAEAGEDPGLTAALAGAEADRLGWAFASGYQAALERLLPDLDGARASFAVTEDDGARPRDLTCRVEADGATRRVFGRKSFATLAPSAHTLVVIARAGTQADGRPRLEAVRVERDAPGLSMSARPPPPFVPEVPHARIEFDGARGTPLPGDGYVRYVKAFRTAEDVHVLIATLALFVRGGHAAGLPEAWCERGLATLAGLLQLSDAAPDASATHLTLAGLVQQAQQVRDELYACQSDLPTTFAQLLARDRPVFGVAEYARDQRTRSAWRAWGAR